MNVNNLHAPAQTKGESCNNPSLATPTLGQHTLVNIQFEQLKMRLIQNALNCIEDSGMEHNLHVAISEASALAWTTPYPLFMLPCLLEEKINEVCQQHARQRQINSRMRRRLVTLFKSTCMPWENKSAISKEHQQANDY